MKKKVEFVFCIAFVLIVIELIYLSFFAEKRDMSLIIKYITLFITYIVYIVQDRRTNRTYKKMLKFYKEEYKDTIGDAFNKNRRSYNKLFDAIYFCNIGNGKKAHKILNRLVKKCKSKKDYFAVYLFQALCYEADGSLEEAIVFYEKSLQYDVGNSTVWSMLGVCYMEYNRMADAKVAYGNALMYNPDNGCAYCNLGDYYLRVGEPQKALDNALKALRIKPSLYQAMSLVAIAYKMLGDEENAEKYCKMYGANGGSAWKLREELQKIG